MTVALFYFTSILVHGIDRTIREQSITHIGEGRVGSGHHAPVDGTHNVQVFVVL